MNANCVNKFYHVVCVCVVYQRRKDPSLASTNTSTLLWLTWCSSGCHFEWVFPPSFYIFIHLLLLLRNAEAHSTKPIQAFKSISTVFAMLCSHNNTDEICERAQSKSVVQTTVFEETPVQVLKWLEQPKNHLSKFGLPFLKSTYLYTMLDVQILHVQYKAPLILDQIWASPLRHIDMNVRSKQK